jgi:hypothetical protein
MSPLADAIYNVLYSLVPTIDDPRITRAELSKRIRADGFHIDGKTTKVAEALAEIAQLCLDQGIPVLPAIVVKSVKGRVELPEAWYFRLVHPQAATHDEQREAWETEMEKVKRTNYPFLL